MDGGAPAGISILPGFDECCTTRKIMVTMTRQGKRRTTPSGTEMLELPRSRILRPKKDILGLSVVLLFSEIPPNEVMLSAPDILEAGARFAIFEVNPMLGSPLHMQPLRVA